MSCPFDTDGDGNCGRILCPHCGPGRRSMSGYGYGDEVGLDETWTAEAGHVPMLAVQRPSDGRFLLRYRGGEGGVWQEGQDGAMVVGPARGEMIVLREGVSESGMECRLVQKTCDMVSDWKAVVLPDGDVVQGDEIMCRGEAVAISNDGVALCRSCAIRMTAENDPDIRAERWTG